MNIILTGLRGSGKTTVGQLLAKKLKWNFIDLDQSIEKQERKKIKNIVAKQGWEGFREAENRATQKLVDVRKTIIATGGGTIMNPINEKIFKQLGRIFYLYVTPEIAAERTKDDATRPALTEEKTHEEELKELYVQRNGKYCQSAFRVIQRTDNPGSDADEILEILDLQA